MDTFEERVEKYRKQESETLIDNAAWDHAQLLFKNLLEVAAEKGEPVRIITGHMNNKFYSSLVKELQDCLDKGISVEAIITDAPNIDLSTNQFARILKEKGALILAQKGESIVAPHMLLIGDKAQRFRLEVDHQQTKAVASFGNKSMGAMLISVYKNAKRELLALHSVTQKNKEKLATV